MQFKTSDLDPAKSIPSLPIKLNVVSAISPLPKSISIASDAISLKLAFLISKLDLTILIASSDKIFWKETFSNSTSAL